MHPPPQHQPRHPPARCPPPQYPRPHPTQPQPPHQHPTRRRNQQPTPQQARHSTAQSLTVPHQRRARTQVAHQAPTQRRARHPPHQQSQHARTQWLRPHQAQVQAQMVLQRLARQRTQYPKQARTQAAHQAPTQRQARHPLHQRSQHARTQWLHPHQAQVPARMVLRRLARRLAGWGLLPDPRPRPARVRGRLGRGGCGRTRRLVRTSVPRGRSVPLARTTRLRPWRLWLWRLGSVAVSGLRPSGGRVAAGPWAESGLGSGVGSGTAAGAGWACRPSSTPFAARLRTALVAGPLRANVGAPRGSGPCGGAWLAASVPAFPARTRRLGRLCPRLRVWRLASARSASRRAGC